DGVTAAYPRYYRQSMEQLQKEQRRLLKCRIGSKNRNKQRIRVARLHEKVSHQRKDFLHKLSRQITNVYDAVCIEDLNMQGMSQSLNFGKSVHDNGWGIFTSLLDYKLSEQGKKLIKIDKWYPSSKTCSCCGNVKEELSLSERIYQCECGFVCDRDVNAARNIKKQGMLVLA
ncbi:RNA-guided endonuclease InsQ/TnpB family protein, partial [Lacrimispora celerecrescens]